MAKTKKVPQPKAQPKAKPATYGVEREHDLPWNDKKVAVFKALAKLGKSVAADVAKEAAVTARDVRHYCYHAKAAGLVEVEQAGNEYRFALTTKGKSVDPAQALKAQQAAKGKAAKGKAAISQAK